MIQLTQAVGQVYCPIAHHNLEGEGRNLVIRSRRSDAPKMVQARSEFVEGVVVQFATSAVLITFACDLLNVLLEN